MHDHLVPPDTVYYWNLTRHIFRFSPNVISDRYNSEHTVNEGEPRRSSHLAKQAQSITPQRYGRTP
ncbi:hypothetical protein BS17DRAFT_785232 [Gyrodon lividus]|nr:hypothetical protein BS17DRAFT_785232 [Gyrodon lividus]